MGGWYPSSLPQHAACSQRHRRGVSSSGPHQRLDSNHPIWMIRIPGAFGDHPSRRVYNSCLFKDIHTSRIAIRRGPSKHRYLSSGHGPSSIIRSSSTVGCSPSYLGTLIARGRRRRWRISTPRVRPASVVRDPWLADTRARGDPDGGLPTSREHLGMTLIQSPALVHPRTRDGQLAIGTGDGMMPRCAQPDATVGPPLQSSHSSNSEGTR